MKAWRPDPESRRLLRQSVTNAQAAIELGIGERTIERYLAEHQDFRVEVMQNRKELRRPKHGTRASYRAGCRCIKCRSDNTAQCAVRRRRRVAASGGLCQGPHPPSAYSNSGCRCSKCQVAHRTGMVKARAGRMTRPDKIPHGTRSGYNAWGCRCTLCRVATNRYSRHALASVQARTSAVATRYGYVWTGPELELLCRRDLTARELAWRLGRTYYAVTAMRSRVRTDPRKERLAGVVSGQGGAA